MRPIWRGICGARTEATPAERAFESGPGTTEAHGGTLLLSAWPEQAPKSKIPIPSRNTRSMIIAVADEYHWRVVMP